MVQQKNREEMGNSLLNEKKRRKEYVDTYPSCQFHSF